MKKTLLLIVMGIVMLFSQSFGQTQDNSLLKHTRFKVYFGQNYIESISIDRARAQSLIGGSGNYKFTIALDYSSSISQTTKNNMIAQLGNYNPSSVGQLAPVGISPDRSSYGSFNASSPARESVVFSHRHYPYPPYLYLCIRDMNSSSGPVFFASMLIAPNNPPTLTGPDGSALQIDVDRTKILNGHRNVCALAYHNTSNPSFNPWPSQQQGNHVYYSNFTGNTIAENSAANSISVQSISTISPITYSSLQVTNNGDGTSNVKFIGLSGGAGKYEIWVDDPTLAEYIHLPLSKNQGQFLSIPYFRYYGNDNEGGASMSVRLKNNQTTNVRVRSAFDYDNYSGLGNVWYDHGYWLGGDQDGVNFVNKIVAMSNNSLHYTTFPINPTGPTCSSIVDGTSLGTWNISVAGVNHFDLKARVINGQKWVTQVIPTNNPNIPEGYGRLDAFVVRGPNMLGRSDVTTSYSGLQSCFAGGVTGYGGLSIPSQANPFSTPPPGYIYATAGDGTPYYYKPNSPCDGIVDGTNLGTWNISFAGLNHFDLKARVINGQKWVTQVIPTNNPSIPEGYGRLDAFVVRGPNMLGRSDVTTSYSGLQSCFAGGVTGYGGLSIPSQANPFSTPPPGYIYATAGDGTPYYYKPANGPCGAISDGTVIGTWNISVAGLNHFDLKARYFNGGYWVTQVIPTNNPNIPEGYGKQDAFVVRGANMLGRSDVTSNFANLQSCFQGGNTDYGGLMIPTLANPFSPMPSGYIFGYGTDGTPYYYKNAGSSKMAGSNIGDENEIKIYPNPAKDRLTIEACNWATAQLEITIFDVLGTKVLDKSIATSSLDCKSTIDIEKLASGSYILRVQDGGLMQTKRFVKE